jgi:TonB family protein
MRPLRSLAPILLALGVAVAGASPLLAQEEPLAAGSEGVPVPKKTKHVQPTYPQEALAQGVRGIVILDIVVDTQGKVESTNIVRSVPGLDEAAIAAARQWGYEPTKVDGKPVRVRITVPITFALALPQLARQDGVPELRQGVTPAWPAGADGGQARCRRVTLEPDGRVGGARVLDGGAPWSDRAAGRAADLAVRAAPDDAILSFRVEAEFVSPRGSAPSRGGSPSRRPGFSDPACWTRRLRRRLRSPCLPFRLPPQRLRPPPPRPCPPRWSRPRPVPRRRPCPSADARPPVVPAALPETPAASDHPSSTGSPGHAATLRCLGRPAGRGDHRTAARGGARERRLGHPRRDARAGRSRPDAGPPACGPASRPHGRDLGHGRGVLLRRRRGDDVDPGCCRT